MMYLQLVLMGLLLVGVPAAAMTGIGAYLGRRSGVGSRIFGAQLGALLGFPCVVATYLALSLGSQELTETLTLCSGPILKLALVGGFFALLGGTLGSRSSEKAIIPCACLAVALSTAVTAVLLLLNAPPLL